MRIGRPQTRGARCRAFTFAEMLAAMVFVAIVIPVAIEGLTIANRMGVVAERKRVATQLASRLLTEAIVTESWLTGESEGEFEDQYEGYRWTLAHEPWPEDFEGLSIELVTVEVFYPAQGREYSVSLSTLVEGVAEE